MDTLAELLNVLRLPIFVAVLAIGLLWQWYRPYKLVHHPWKRLGNHMALMSLGVLIMRLFAVIGPWACAYYAMAWQFGLFQQLHWPIFLEVLICIIVLDAVIYWQHRVFHRWPLLWRFHRVHHTDRTIDTSTALRFHPLELLISLLIKSLAVLLLGAPLLAVVGFEILLSAMALIGHTNAQFSTRWQRLVSPVLVTPSMHRIHHSSWQPQTDSNYGTVLTLWDRLFGSYREDDAVRAFGLGQNRTEGEDRFDRLLKQPFQSSIK